MPPLPIDEALPQLERTLAAGPAAVVVAPPGAGKTTRLPLVLIGEPWMEGRRLILLEPRRLAARAAAERMAATLGERVGDTVGLRVRLGSKVSARTRVEVVTEGVFARMILADPELAGVGCVIFDEFHERSLDADLGLALALDVQRGLRDDLRILVMSATLDGARVAALLGAPDAPAPVVVSEGRAFPVETRYLGRDPQRPVDEQVSGAVLRALRAEAGSLLVFLPGQGEIGRVERRLRERIGDPAIHIAPLYGALDPRAQDAVVAPAPAGVRKIVLATAVAETSLTIEGVRVVIDSGLARVPRYEPAVGLTRLETVRVSKAAADQRRGRAGRTEPGVCYRLWEEPATAALEPYARPEILAADLAPLVLDCAAWGVTDPRTLAFLDPPPQAALREATALLGRIGALDGDGRLTAVGRRLHELPLPPRLARMLIAAADVGAAEFAARIAAVIVERGLGGTAVDLDERLERFARDRSRRADDMRRLASGWARQAAAGAAPPAAREPPSSGLALAWAFPDRIAKARGKTGEFLLANGRGAVLEAAEGLAREPLIVVADVVGAAQAARILLAAPISLADVETSAGAVLEERRTVEFDAATASLRARAVRRLGALALAERPLAVPADGDSAAHLARGVASLGTGALPWTKALAQWRDRILFLRRAEGAGEGWPDLGDAALAASAETWLAPLLVGKTALADVTAGDLEQALAALVPWSLRHRLEAEAPTHVEVPTGSRIPVDYSGEDGPVLAVRVQELFGLDRHPAIAGGRTPLVLHLLSPAQRPIQITRDLPGFWRGSWTQVKADMRGRYPKHHWPDDPLSAPPTRRAGRPG
ncbi:ATP-dependent helicase [Chelatococcus reniformis]|uniref:ATP-dependent helicase n=1 Tax=Chelatococcus reniformis TaxID=1494448 RepID=A0A916X6N9_9HYPH|nr:ATP-dependent helicase [Chelatococcus reniformis]